MAKITSVTGFEILDSRGNPTVAAEVVLADGAHGFARSRKRQRSRRECRCIAKSPRIVPVGSVAKYNRLLRIQHELGADALYAGSSAFARFLKSST